MKVKRLLYFAAIVMVFVWFRCAKNDAAKDIETPSAAGKAKTDAESVKHKVLAFNLEGLTEKGAKKWDINGRAAEAISETEIHLDKIIAKSYGDEAEATITADSGVYDKSKNNVRLQKNVKATIVNTQQFASDFGGVPNSALKAKADDLIKSTQEKKKSKTTITCDSDVLFDYEHNQAYFTKNVKVVNEDVTIEADKITVNLDPATRRMKEIEADGNVKITRGDNVTYSDKATYIDADKRVVLTGKPKLVIYREGSGFDGDIFGK